MNEPQTAWSRTTPGGSPGSPLGRRPEGLSLKIIILEKHYQDVAVATASAPSARTLSQDFAAAYDP